MSDVLAVVPARDEAARVGDTVRALRDAGMRVLVVDDASTDGTAALARDAGAEVLTLRARRGKGGALAAGLARADAPVIVLIDADLGATASIASALAARVLSGDADLVIGAPPRTGASGFGLVERFARGGIRLLGGRSLARPLSGQRAATLEVLRRVRLARGFGVEVAMTIDALRAGYRVEEIEASFTHARTGRDAAGFVHRARQGLHIARALLSCALRPRRAEAWTPSS